MDILSSSPPNGTTDSMLFPSYWGGGSSVYRRSSSVSDVLGSSDDDLNSEFGRSPCLYFARGYCKNGSSCRFVRGLVGSPAKIESNDQCHELLRFKSAAAQVQQQRLAAASHLMGSSSFPYSPKSMNLSVQQQQNDTQRAAGAAAMMLNEDIHKFGRSRLERNDFSMNGNAGILNPASRQIYLTFPADSTFREEDVSNYFSIYGPVQDVRIPYQQKRMFGFVTFLYPETVKIILANGNESTREGNKDVLESLEHNLPDSPFVSPTKGNREYFSTFSNDASGNEEDSANDNLVSANASIDMESFKSFNCQMPG